MQRQLELLHSRSHCLHEAPGIRLLVGLVAEASAVVVVPALTVSLCAVEVLVALFASPP
jgi:hypothetical protein